MTESGEDKAKKKKRSPWSKYLNLVFRVFHVAVGSVLFGGLFWHHPFAQMQQWHRYTIVTGLLLIGSGLFQSRHWIYQGRGVSALLHCALVWLVHRSGGEMAPALMVVLASGVIGSHLPGNIRHYSLVHRCRMD